MEQINESLGKRLKEALLKQGFRSSVSITGVQVSPLAKHLNVSVQTIRKYLADSISPDFEKITTIADFLKISPCWLAFGNNKSPTFLQKNFEIKKIFLKEICQGLFKNILNFNLEHDLLEFICDFLYGIINDIAQLESSDEMKLKLIKTAIYSASIMEKIKWKKMKKIQTKI